MPPGLGERLCEACGSTTTLSVLSPTLPPRIEMESFDMIPFSVSRQFSLLKKQRLTPSQESFSGLIEEDDDLDDDCDDLGSVHMMLNDMSYNVQRYSPEWDDEDIAEVMVLSPKPRNSKLPTISEELDASSPRSNRADCGESVPPLDSPFLGSDETHCCETLAKEPPPVTLSDFDVVVPPSGLPVFCKKRSSGKLYIVKALEGWNTGDELAVVEAIQNLRAPFLEDFLWKFPGVAEGEEGRMYIVSASHSGNLLDLMKTGPIAPMDVLFYICEIVDGLASLHNAKIIHRDLAPSNIFLDHAGHIVLSNFSNAVANGWSDVMPPSAAIEYQAPEILLGWAHDMAVDCWSLGILFHVLLAGTNPIVASVDANLTVRSQILEGQVVMSEMLPREAKDLITKCLERNPKLRATIEQVRDHEHFATVDWYGVRQKKICEHPFLHPSSGT
ncbi:kinase-like domain-containing protein [Roridomyces roridus]|uniref:Kinase-like domain-containing protein n=1 Tax=Roridomyces roridus TaxID=1738132 RepID=A0AAD7CG63_9AGAR|nr:kinase-like domain-containing protein [Roridomyces roridus]